MKVKSTKIFQALVLATTGFLLAVFAVEISLRLGFIPNNLHRATWTEGIQENPRHQILVLGDSFMNHWHSGDSVYELLLKDLEPYRVEILNTAAGGRGPSDYLNLLRRHGPRFRPDLILLSYYVGNDLTNFQYRTTPKEPSKLFFSISTSTTSGTSEWKNCFPLIKPFLPTKPAMNRFVGPRSMESTLPFLSWRGRKTPTSWIIC